jgi:hypothetical protein
MHQGVIHRENPLPNKSHKISFSPNPPTANVQPPIAFHSHNFALHDFASCRPSSHSNGHSLAIQAYMHRPCPWLEEHDFALHDFAFLRPFALCPLSRHEAQSLVMFQSAPVQKPLFILPVSTTPPLHYSLCHPPAFSFKRGLDKN